ncbi:MAG TPA: DUF2619 domain-containing protein [Bacillota bacterium]|jgi:hypothetical protein|nr:DUF2619 domain-containing protein [Bacillota bacterium]
MEERAVQSMASLRIISGLIEIVAAIVIMRFGRVETALRINALLGLIGPIVFIVVSALGIVAVAVKIVPMKVAFLAIGFLLVLLGTK